MIAYFKTYFQQAHFLLLPLSIFLITACPEQPATASCGTHQIEVNGNCECEPGYHWNEDQTKCLMDTTSHNFVWEIDTLGGYGSYLNDVAIIDENNIWVVGNIETDTATYNAAHWDGSVWELILIGVPGVIGEGIFYFADNDIWVATGIIYHWNGEEWERYHLWDMGVLGANDGGVTEIWGTSSSNIYFAGRKGSIVHYDGSEFTRMESGTEVKLTDIWGIDNEHIWVVGEASGYLKSVVLYFNGIFFEQIYYNDWTEEQNCDSLCGNMRTIWTCGNHVFMGGSAGIWDKDIDSTKWNLTKDVDVNPTGMFERRIRGNDTNDILIVGNDLMGFHFNGSTWKDVMYNVPFADLLSVDMHSSICVAVGYTTESKALIVMGYR